MADITLTSCPALGGYDRDFSGTTLSELANMTLTSLALPMGGEAEVTGALQKAWRCPVPEPGQSVPAGTGGHLLRMTTDQLMLIEPDGGTIPAALADACYTTDQTGAWVALRLCGPLAVTALARLCPLDLHPQVFPPGAQGRTVMEHMSAVVLRETEDSFLLLSASSSAGSFLHAMETSLENVD